MKNLGLLVSLKAKQGKENEVASFLKSAESLARKEDKTITWYAFQIDEKTFGIMDTFEKEEGREAHINGEIAKALFANAEELLSEEPKIQKLTILAAK